MSRLKFIVLEYHWIYRFVVQDESIRLMDESCGYIEHVDDDSVFGFVSGKDLGSKSSTPRRKDKERNLHARYNRFRAYRRRQPTPKNEFGVDVSMKRDNSLKHRSLFDEQDDEEDPRAKGIGGYVNTENIRSDYNRRHDEGPMRGTGTAGGTLT
jgi:hypothetical protein